MQKNKRQRFILLVIITVIAVLISYYTEHKTYVLVVTGGKKIEKESFLQMFKEMDQITFHEAIQPEAKNMFASKRIKQYCAIVFYDVSQEITEEQKQAFLNLLEEGKGIVFLHHALVSYQNWDEYENIVGGRYYHKSETDTTRPVSTYRHDVEIPVEIVNPEHPVTKGLTDFIIHDEVYGNYNVLDDVTPLLNTKHPESESIIAWTHRYKNAKIVYLQSGHDHHAFEDANYRKLVEQAIKWVAE